MAKYIDADFLINEIEKYNNENWDNLTWSSHMVASFLRGSPRVDAVEVVRCKDCIFYGKDKKGCCSYYYYTESGAQPIYMKQCDFCSYGERKER